MKNLFDTPKLPVWGLAAVAGAGLVSLVTVYDGVPTATAGIVGSKHDLTSSGGGQSQGGATTNQICVFCHTPHGSDTAAPVPLWNKKFVSTSGYTSYSQLGTATLEADTLDVGSISLACLSCHDGSQAMDNMLNAPGSGNYNAAGASFSTGGAAMTGTPIPMLGKDLRNDHPIGIQYCGGGITSSNLVATTYCRDKDFKDVAVDAASGTKPLQYYVDRNTDGAKQKDDITLYSRDFSGATGTPSVECGSCHDPHEAAKGTDGVYFMRVTTSGSAICLACHVK